jgi:hypothetical protein
LCGLASFQEKIASIRRQIRGEFPLIGDVTLTRKNRKAPQGRLSKFHECRCSQQILAKQLALRELERLARLGAAVLLALNHA